MAADLNTDGLFHGITGMFNIFSGVISGVEVQAPTIGQLLAVGLVLSVVLAVIAGVFGVLKSALGGWGGVAAYGRKL